MKEQGKENRLWLCACGNSDISELFVCLKARNVGTMITDWVGTLWLCHDCGRITEPRSRKAVGFHSRNSLSDSECAEIYLQFIRP